MCANFIDISQDSVEMHLRCGGICNNHVIANCVLSVRVKKCENRSIMGEVKSKKVKCHVLYGLRCRCVVPVGPVSNRACVNIYHTVQCLAGQLMGAVS